MTTEVYSAFVVKRGDLFCRFGSHRTCRLVASPLKANLYARRGDAERRMKQGHTWVGGEVTPLQPSDLRVVQISMQVRNDTEPDTQEDT